MNGESRIPGPAKQSIDWAAIHARLHRATLALEEKLAPTAVEKKRILRERAKILAREPASEPEGNALDLVEFILAYERYAIESAWVSEIHPLKEITPLPGTPHFISGIINVRGKIVSVVDLKKLFDLPARGLTDLNKVILIGNGTMEFGLLADAVPGICRIFEKEIQSDLPTPTGIRPEYLRGVTAERLAILDAARLLADPHLRICQTDT